MVLWTRLAGALDPLAVPVRWEIATDEAMKSIIFSGEATAEPAWAHSVHVEVKGLSPERWYWYRFTTAGAESAVGRTRTAPAADAAGPRLRFAFASCQQYEQGYFGAYRHIAADAPDLVAFLGDYIYESTWGRDHVRKHDAAEPYTLEDYRARYALYRSDPDLQAAHAACPWIVTWDDHEVDNDYADDRPEDGMERAPFLERRAAAYRAYYEHMPLPARMRPKGPDMRIHTHLDWGQLARFHILDTRQYRSWQACPRKGRRGGSNTSTSSTASACRVPGARCSAARRSAGSSRTSASQARRGTCSRRPRPWRSSTPSPAPAGAPGPMVGMGIPLQGSVSFKRWPRRKLRTRWCSAATSIPST